MYARIASIAFNRSCYAVLKLRRKREQKNKSAHQSQSETLAGQSMTVAEEGKRIFFFSLSPNDRASERADAFFLSFFIHSVPVAAFFMQGGSRSIQTWLDMREIRTHRSKTEVFLLQKSSLLRIIFSFERLTTSS